MIAVEGHHVADHCGHREHAHPILGACLKLHALLDFARALHGALRHALNPRRVVPAVAFGGGRGARRAKALMAPKAKPHIDWFFRPPHTK